MEGKYGKIEVNYDSEDLNKYFYENEYIERIRSESNLGFKEKEEELGIIYIRSFEIKESLRKILKMLETELEGEFENLIYEQNHETEKAYKEIIVIKKFAEDILEINGKKTENEYSNYLKKEVFSILLKDFYEELEYSSNILIKKNALNLFFPNFNLDNLFR